MIRIKRFQLNQWFYLMWRFIYIPLFWVDGLQDFTHFGALCFSVCLYYCYLYVGQLFWVFFVCVVWQPPKYIHFIWVTGGLLTCWKTSSKNKVHSYYSNPKVSCVHGLTLLSEVSSSPSPRPGASRHWISRKMRSHFKYLFLSSVT